MCCLKFSKSIIPFAITFAVGIFIAFLFSSFTSLNRVITPKVEVNDVRIQSSMNEVEGCLHDEETNLYSLQSNKEKRIVKPTFKQTLIINKNVEKTH